MAKVWWILSHGFCSKFYMFSSNAKNFVNRLRFDKVAESLKVGTFFETQCRLSVYVTPKSPKGGSKSDFFAF